MIKKKRQLFFSVYVASCVLLSLIQALLGTEVKYVLMGLVSLIIAGSPLFFFGIFDITALFAFGLLSKYSIFPFFIKTLMGERIDMGLLVVDKTFPVITVGTFVVAAALFASKAIHIRKRLMDIRLSNKELLVFGYISYSLGFIFAILQAAMRPQTIAGETTAGFGGFGEFSGLLYLGIICVTAHLVRSGTKRNINIPIIIMLLGSLSYSLLNNEKLSVTLALFSWLITLVVSGRKISLRFIAVAVLLAIGYLSVVVPVIQVSRSDVFRELSLSQRVDFISNLISGRGMKGIYQAMEARFNYQYYPDLHSPLVDNLGMVEDVDVVLDGINKSNTIGWQPVPLAFQSSTPHFLMPDKVPEVDVDFIAYKIGLISHLFSIRQSMGVFGVSYAMFMWPGWMMITFILLFLYFLMIRKLLYPYMIGNIFGIYILMKYAPVFSEAGVENLLENMLRGIPLDVISILIILTITRALLSKNPHKFSRIVAVTK